MISESALESFCRPAILGRARIIAQREGRIWDRCCLYEGKLTHLSARVDSSSGYTDTYDASITLDEASDQVFSYECTCPAARKFAGPCKHSIALALDFNHNAELYEGFSSTRHVTTSAVISSFLDRTTRTARPRLATPAADASGSVRVVVRLMRDNDIFLGLRLAGARGSYVVRDLSDFEASVSDEAFFEYGKNLAFTHRIDAFAQESRELVRFVCRCVRNRRSYASNRVYGRVYATSGSSLSLGKELRLSGPEIDELMALLKGSVVTFETSQGAQAGRAREVLVTDGDPDLGVRLACRDGDAVELVREGAAEVFSTGEHVYALQDGRLYCCSQKMLPVAAFLQQVYCSQASELLMTYDDARRFVVAALPQIEGALPVSVPPELDELRPDPLRLEFLLDRSGQLVTCDARARYGEREVSLFDRIQGDEALWRDVQAEADARAVVTRYFTTAREAGLLVSRPDVESVARIVFEGVEELSRIGVVRVSDAFRRMSVRRRPQVRVGVTSRGGLIDLSVSAEDLPPAELLAVLTSYRMRKRYHRLRDGSLVDLWSADIDEAARLADELELSARALASGSVAIPAYKAFLLDALVSDDEKSASFAEAVRGFREVNADAYEPPASLAPRLRPYQVAGYQWICALMDMGFGGVLADEMGLGKSVQVIAALLARRGEGPTLIVCPASLVYNWVAEFAKFAPELNVVAVSGDAKERRELRSEQGHEVLITSYDLLRRDVEDYASTRFWCVVLDEAQYVKNHQTLASKAVKTLDARHRLALTGTPIENRLSELWSIFDFLMPGLLGGYERFRERYELPISEGDEDAARTLSAAIGPFVLRRSKAGVLDDLPEKLEQVVACRMGRTQRELYAAREQALRESLSQGSGAELGRERMQVLAELTRLRQLCCDPRLVYEDYDGGSCKLDTIWQLVSQAIDARAKVLVFSQFTSFLALIAERLDREETRYYTITGATPKQQRVQLVDAFNADDTPVFLVSLRAGGTGLNLVGASVVIHADPWWNIAVQDQATDRAHRIGQTRDVTVYKVIAAHSIEERIVALQEAKSDLVERFVGVGGGPAALSALRREDLVALLDA